MTNQYEPVYAKRIFRHYFQLLAERSGQPFDADCINEIGIAVDDIVELAVDASVAKMSARIEALENELKALRASVSAMPQEAQLAMDAAK